MTNVDNPLKTKELRMRVWVMLRRTRRLLREDNDPDDLFEKDDE
jgi:hypothetical protein